MRILIDREALQARHHLKDNLRLGALITTLISTRHTVLFSCGQVLTQDELDSCDVLLMTSRSPGQYPPTESTEIRDFVRRGGGLMLLSNHGDPEDSEDLTLHAAQLARDCRFDVAIERTFFIARHEGERTTLQGEALNSHHPILSGADDRAPVRSLVTNTCCSLTSANGETLATLPDHMRDKLSDRSPHGLLFAVALQAGTGLESGCKGRVVVVADSGFIGTDGTAYPGVGLIGHGHNLRFAVRALRWLAGELTH